MRVNFVLDTSNDGSSNPYEDGDIGGSWIKAAAQQLPETAGPGEKVKSRLGFR